MVQCHRFFYSLTLDQSGFGQFGYYSAIYPLFIRPPVRLKLFNFKLFTRPQTCACYHCGERVPVRDVVKMLFDGKERDLCCHGCEAVLMMVEANGLSAEYLSEKNSAQPLTN